MDSPLRKHLFFATSTGPRAAFCDRVRERVVPEILPLAQGTLKIGLTERPNPRLTVLPLRAENLLMVSAWGEVDAAAFLDVLARDGSRTFGYRVSESYPVAYDRTWSDGTRSPGDVLLTLLSKAPAIDHAAFMHEWHGRHTPKALRIHPMWNYVRNVVDERLPDAAPVFEGVVEEHYRELRDIVNPVRMFGGPLRFLPNMIEVATHVKHFLDLRATENYLLRETFLVTRH